MKNKGLVLIFLVFSSLAAFAQISREQERDTLIHLREVSITSNRIELFSAGTHVEAFDKEVLALNRTGSVSELLSNHSNLQVNSYGPGGVSNVSIRGGNTRNTAVLWNGLNLQSPMHGGTNLSNIPVAFFDAVKIQKGHTVSLFGSGSTSGIVHLNNSIPRTEGTRVKLFGHTGSYANTAGGVSMSVRKNHYSTRLNAFYHKADNNFRYKNPYPFGDKIKRQKNAGFTQQGVLWDHTYQLKNNQLLSGGVWYQRSDKDVQGLMTFSRPEQANQIDNTVRGYLKYNRYRRNYSVKIRQGIIFDDFRYSDPEGPVYLSQGSSFSALTEAEANFIHSENYRLSAGVSNIIEECSSDGYTSQVTRYRHSLYSSFSIKPDQNNVKISVNARQERVDNEWMPFVFSVGGVYFTPLEGMDVSASFSKNNLIPTFNDLYWKESSFASGNSDLKNELSWNSEVGIHWKKALSGMLFEFSNQFFQNRYRNLIIWLPDQDGIWAPENKEQVVSSGMELSVSGKRTGEVFEYGLNMAYSFTHASELNEHTDEEPTPLIYTPRNKIGSTLNVSHYSGLSCSFSYRYTGDRYYDFIHRIAPYQLLDVTAGYDFSFLGNEVEAHLKIYNLLNEDYQVMAWYAMPLRHFQLQLIINI